MKTDQDMQQFFAGWDGETINNLAHGHFTVTKSKHYTHLHPIITSPTSVAVKFRTNAEVIAFLRAYHEKRIARMKVVG